MEFDYEAHDMTRRLEFLAGSETAADLLKRVSSRPLVTGLDFIDRHVHLRPGNVMEITGPPGSGKTEVLLQLAASCLCSFVGGDGTDPGGSVVILDLDGKIQADRVVLSVHRHLLRTLPPDRPFPPASQQQHGQNANPQQAPQQAALEAALRRALSGLTVVRCYSSREFVQALAVADRLFPPEAGARGGVAASRMLLVDNIAAHWWEQRSVRVPPDCSEGDRLALLTVNAVGAAAAAALQRVARRSRAIVAATKNATRVGGRQPAWGSGEGGAMYGARPSAVVSHAPFPPASPSSSAPSERAAPVLCHLRSRVPAPPPMPLAAAAAGPVYRDVMAQQWAAVLTHSVVLHPKCYTEAGEHVMQCFWQAPGKLQACDFVIPPPPGRAWPAAA